MREEMEEAGTDNKRETEKTCKDRKEQEQTEKERKRCEKPENTFTWRR